MKVQCPHCQHDHELTLAPGRQVLRCDACYRNFPFVAPEAPEGGASSKERGAVTPKRGLNESTQIIPIAAVQPPAPEPVAAAPAPLEDGSIPTAPVALPRPLPEAPIAAPLPDIRSAQPLPPLPRTFPDPSRGSPTTPRPLPGDDEEAIVRTAPVTLPFGSPNLPRREEAPLGPPILPRAEDATARTAPVTLPFGSPSLPRREESTLVIPVPLQEPAAPAKPREQALPPPPEAPAPRREDVTQLITAPPPQEPAPLPAAPLPRKEEAASTAAPAAAPPSSPSRHPTREQALPAARPNKEPSLPPGRHARDKEASLPPGRHTRDKEASLPPGRHATKENPKEPSQPPGARKTLTQQPRQTGSRPALSPSPTTTGSRKALRATAPARPAPDVSTDPHGTPAFAERDVTSLSTGMRLGGYLLQRKLGAGAMGTVWLARQLSLDRDVALKILRPSLARDPQFVYRFTQEAFAAAQLVHHNIVQIYDCGSERRAHYFSMEYVDAESLLTLVERQGRLDPEVAAGYILQAARGLKFAHDRGMVHRDIKPDNLLLNRNGIVKVADLGLVKRSQAAKAARAFMDENSTETDMDLDSFTEQVTTNPGANESALGGTPAYMSPEQVESAARVDARSDIYSLGCTFYYLLTGRPPFMSESVAALMGMHVMEPPMPPDERVRRVPKGLSDIVLRMLAKAPQDRFQDMGELIRALEAFLGIEAAVSFSPREEHANLLERCVQGFNEAPWVRRRHGLVLAFGFLCVLAAAAANLRLGPLPSLGVVAFAACTQLTSFLIRGRLQKETLFIHVREFVSQAPFLTWLLWLLLLGGAGYGLHQLQLEVPAAFVVGSALLTAVAFYALVDRRVAAERKPFVSQVEQMLRSMRLKGLEESALRQFVCKYSGEVWEDFYEQLFGYEAKLLAREKWGRNDRGLLRETHATWREPLIRWMDALQHARKQRRERRQLRVLERAKVKAEGSTKAPAASA